MLKFNNNHIFTGYLKQLLSSINIPTCKIYTREFEQYLKKHKTEDPRVITSFDNISYAQDKASRIGSRTLYLKNNELFSYFWKAPKDFSKIEQNTPHWQMGQTVYFDKENEFKGLTKVLNSPGNVYDSTTHEYLGDYLRFLRDYHNINLMPLYNCFNNKIYNNIYYDHTIKTPSTNEKIIHRIFNSQDSNFNIYAFPVKLFSDYTIAIDCDQSIEMFCGLYKTTLDRSTKCTDLINKTYKKINKTVFKQPFLYDKLNIKNWKPDAEIVPDESGVIPLLNENVISRCDIINREQDLKLFIKIPVACKSSITVLEGDYRVFNNCSYIPSIATRLTNLNDPTSVEEKTVWSYNQNHAIMNFDLSKNHKDQDKSKKINPEQDDLNYIGLKPIGKLQLLEFNNGESYPFSDRLIEYLSGSAITSIDEISDNIKRVQKVMENNSHYFKISGLWEDKMQRIIYDYIMNRGPVVYHKKTEKLVVKNQGRHPAVGYTKKSNLYDILGYVDRDAEKWYANWKKDNKTNKAVMANNILNVDIYDGLYDI